MRMNGDQMTGFFVRTFWPTNKIELSPNKNAVGEKFENETAKNENRVKVTANRMQIVSMFIDGAESSLATANLLVFQCPIQLAECQCNSLDRLYSVAILIYDSRNTRCLLTISSFPVVTY
uniref:Uncharacterized protein n=1 Tax=Syphacia muris TaxID=451379 RepID=A0A0N5A848_9BILA